MRNEHEAEEATGRAWLLAIVRNGCDERQQQRSLQTIAFLTKK